MNMLFIQTLISLFALESVEANTATTIIKIELHN